MALSSKPMLIAPASLEATMGQAMVLVTERGLQGDRYASAAGVASNIDPSDLRSYYDAAGKDLIIYPGLQYPLVITFYQSGSSCSSGTEDNQQCQKDKM